MQMRVASLWFPKLPSERILRARPVDAPFALTITESNTDRIYCLNDAAQTAGVAKGMGLSDARALFPDLRTLPADPMADQRFLHTLARWANRYCPWVGLEGGDGLVMNITGSAHLLGGEDAMLMDMQARLNRSQLDVRIGFADTRGAAWAVAHYGEGIVKRGQTLAKIGRYPIGALRLDGKTCVGLQRLGIETIAELHALPRGTITRRFGREAILRLDQAMGEQPEQLSPMPEPAIYAARLSLPDPIGLVGDVMAGTERLLEQVCTRLTERERGARTLQLSLRRVDHSWQQVELRLARPLREAARILPLFQKAVDEVNAGFGIDLMRLEATQVEHLPLRQTASHANSDNTDGLDDLITRLGNRIGLDNIIRFLPAQSNIPERSYIVAPAAYSKPEGPWVTMRPRPLRMFPPEAITASGRRPPTRFRWRRMSFATARATGPERITPEWWLEDENWRSGIRDYWRIETRQGRRLWLFYTPQNPNWYVQGEFA